MDIKSGLVGAGAVVLLVGGIFAAGAIANADDIPAGPAHSVVLDEPVAVEKTAAPAPVVPEPAAVTPEPEPVVEAAPAPEVVEPDPVVDPVPAPAVEPEVAVEYAGPPIPAGPGQGSKP
jgi:hypothetical protein